MTQTTASSLLTILNDCSPYSFNIGAKLDFLLKSIYSESGN